MDGCNAVQKKRALASRNVSIADGASFVVCFFKYGKRTTPTAQQISPRFWSWSSCWGATPPLHPVRDDSRWLGGGCARIRSRVGLLCWWCSERLVGRTRGKKKVTAVFSLATSKKRNGLWFGGFFSAPLSHLFMPLARVRRLLRHGSNYSCKRVWPRGWHQGCMRRLDSAILFIDAEEIRLNACTTCRQLCLLLFGASINWSRMGVVNCADSVSNVYWHQDKKNSTVYVYILCTPGCIDYCL